MTAQSKAQSSHDLDTWEVSAVMSQPVVTVPASATMIDALRAFSSSGLRHLAAVDGGGRCVGLLFDRAVAAAWADDPLEFSLLTVGEAVDGIEQPLLGIDDATVTSTAQLMEKCGADAVVVTDAAMHPVGILTAGDLVTLLAHPHLGD